MRKVAVWARPSVNNRPRVVKTTIFYQERQVVKLTINNDSSTSSNNLRNKKKNKFQSLKHILNWPMPFWIRQKQIQACKLGPQRRKNIMRQKMSLLGSNVITYKEKLKILRFNYF